MTFIDISKWQFPVDWPRVRAAGVTAALIRVATGDRIDPRYREHWAGARAAGIPRLGVYVYVVTEVTPLNCVRAVTGFTGGDFGNLPLTLDCERREDERLRPFDRAAYTRNLSMLLVGFRLVTAHPIRIYTSAVEWRAITTLPAWAREYGLHVAHYNAVVTQPDLPSGWATWRWWQYTSTGRVDGIAGDVDLNRENVPAPHPPSIPTLAGEISTLAGSIKELGA